MLWLLKFPDQQKTALCEVHTHTHVCFADYSHCRSRTISVNLLDCFPSCAHRVVLPNPPRSALRVLQVQVCATVAPNSVLKCKLDTFLLFCFSLFLFQDHAGNLSHQSQELMLGCITRLMSHHFDHCFFFYIYKKYILALFLLDQVIYFEYVRKQEGQKKRIYRLSFAFPNITTWFPSLRP